MSDSEPKFVPAPRLTWTTTDKIKFTIAYEAA